MEWDDPQFIAIVDNRRLEEIQKFEVEDGIYTCGKCKGMKTMSYPFQTRSGDEGFTIFIKCANPDCGNMWKIYN